MTDHGRLCDHGFGDRLHSYITDDRCSLVEEDHAEITTSDPQGLQGLIQSINDSHGIPNRAFDTHRPHDGTGKDADLPIFS